MDKNPEPIYWHLHSPPVCEKQSDVPVNLHLTFFGRNRNVGKKKREKSQLYQTIGLSNFFLCAPRSLPQDTRWPQKNPSFIASAFLSLLIKRTSLKRNTTLSVSAPLAKQFVTHRVY